MKKKLISIFVMIILPVIMCCAPVDRSTTYVKDGKTYGVTKGLFRAKWWNYYERGMSYSEGEYWDEAGSDFLEAIRQREDDQRRARTYGMHFIDYFPHRELGIALFGRGDFAGAVKELEVSLSTEESAKAKFYLNMARKSLLFAQIHDKTPPKILVENPVDNVVTNEFFITVSGVAKDENFVSSILINGVPEFIELSQREIRFEKKLSILQGDNPITIEAHDLLGNSSKETLIVIGDFSAPQLSVVNFINGQTVQDKKVRIELSCFDESGIQYINLQDKKMLSGGKKSESISWDISLKQGNNIISMEAADTGGNLIKGDIVLKYKPGTLVALNGFFPVATDALNLIALNSINLGTLKTSASPTDSDSFPPEIRMRGLLKNTNANESLTIIGRLQNNRFFIEGQAADSNGVGFVAINNRLVASQPGKEVIFNRLTELDEGKNPFEIKAADIIGNTDVKSFIIERRIQKIDLKGSRMTLSIMPFKNECISQAFADSVYNLFVDEIIGNERFNVLGRGVELEAILRELKLSQTDLVDQEQAVKTGKLIGSEAIMIGTIIEQKNSIEVFAKLIDTENSTVMASHDVFDMDKKRTKLEFLMEGLASKFVYSIPIVEGKILMVKGDKFYLDISRNLHMNIRSGIKCLAYRAEPFIVDGMVLGEETNILGNLILVDVKEKFSIAKLSEINGQTQDGVMNIRKDDKVITK